MDHTARPAVYNHNNSKQRAFVMKSTADLVTMVNVWCEQLFKRSYRRLCVSRRLGQRKSLLCWLVFKLALLWCKWPWRVESAPKTIRNYWVFTKSNEISLFLDVFIEQLTQEFIYEKLWLLYKIYKLYLLTSLRNVFTFIFFKVLTPWYF